MDMYILSNDNAIPYIEFKIKQKENNTENLYIKDKWNSVNSKKSKELSTGTLLIKIINLYDNIIKVLTECRNMIYESEKIKDGDYRDSVRILKEKLLDINQVLNIIVNYIDCFYIDIFINYNKEMNTIQNELYTAEHLWGILEDNEHKEYYSNLKQKLEYMRTPQCMKDKCLEFFNNLISEFENMKKAIDKSFIYTKEDSMTKIFSGITLMLPKPIIDFSNKYTKNPTPVKYLYKLESLTDFFNCSIYHTYLSGKVIVKCKVCGKYFIPNKTNQIYCNKKCRNLKEDKNADNREATYSTNSYKLYRNIRSRLNRSPKKYEKVIENFKKNYDYNNMLKTLTELYSKDHTIDIELELLKIYTHIDRDLQATYPSNKKYLTSKYWVD